MKRKNKWLLALSKAEAREAARALYSPDYPQHKSGVARAAFVAGALWARRYLRT